MYLRGVLVLRNSIIYFVFALALRHTYTLAAISTNASKRIDFRLDT